jgi:FkbM family methyltransferase
MFRGRYRLLSWLNRRKAVFPKLGRRQVYIPSIRAQMLLDPSDYNGRVLYIEGVHEAVILRAFETICRPGDCVVDVGANIGFFTLAAARLVGKGGKVYAFEACRETYTLLCKNVSLNFTPNESIVLNCSAVSSHDGTANFYMDQGHHSGASSLRILPGGNAASSVVKTIALDSLLSELPPIRLVKIDIEGAEMLALSGMKQLLIRDKPFLVLECSDSFLRELGSSACDLFQYMESMGYRMHRERCGRLLPITAPPENQCNLVCSHWDLELPDGLSRMMD